MREFIRLNSQIGQTGIDNLQTIYQRSVKDKYNMDNQYIVVFITVPTKEVGEKIAKALLDKKLAACVNLISPIHSLYIWDGNINADEEVLLVVKTRTELFTDQLIPAVKAVHPYEVPEIIALPIVMGSSDYLQWIEAVTSGS